MTVHTYQQTSMFIIGRLPPERSVVHDRRLFFHFCSFMMKPSFTICL
jgi:hypothetical protein